MIKYGSVVAAVALAAQATGAGQLQPYNVQTQFGASQVALTESQGDLTVVFGVLAPDGPPDPVPTDTTGQQYTAQARQGKLVAFVAQNVKGGYHVISMPGVNKLVAIEYKGPAWVSGWSCSPVCRSVPDAHSLNYPIAISCSKGELLVWTQLADTPDTWIAPSPTTEVYDQLGTFVVKNALASEEPIQYLPEVLISDRNHAQITVFTLTLRLGIPPLSH